MKIRSALSDVAGFCGACKQAIRGEGHRAGYVEFVEIDDQRYHLKCVGRNNGTAQTITEEEQD